MNPLISGYNRISIDSGSLAAAVQSHVSGKPLEYRRHAKRSATKPAHPRVVAPARVLVAEGIDAIHQDTEKFSQLTVLIDADELTLREIRRANVRKRGMRDVSNG